MFNPEDYTAIESKRLSGIFAYYNEDGKCAGRTCTRCTEAIPAHKFGKSSSGLGGLESRCRECKREHNAEYASSDDFVGPTKRYSERTAAEILADRQRHRPDGVKWCKGCQQEHEFAAFSKNRSRPDGLNTLCRSCDSTARRERDKKPYLDYWQANGIDLECYVCGGTWAEPDHVIPRTLGGSNDFDNRLPICDDCNVAKYNNTLGQFLRERKPEKFEEVFSRVLDIGVDPFTPAEKVSIGPEDAEREVRIKFKTVEPDENRRYEDVTDLILADGYEAQRQQYRR